MIRRGLLLKLFEAAYMPRWNDKLRPVEFFELDKQAHKMFYAYYLARFAGDGVDLCKIIEGGIFELLERIVLTDLKPSVYYRICRNKEQKEKLNDFVLQALATHLETLGEEFSQRFRDYLSGSRTSAERRILAAAHVLSSDWEYQRIKTVSAGLYCPEDPEQDFSERLTALGDLNGMQELRSRNARRFLDLCGQLRFQIRWAPLHRVPRTSVLGHSLFVAVLSYLFSMQAGACPRRCINNYFTGLFHDLPEALTRDIISPIKRSIEGVSELIKEYEQKQMETIIYPLVPDNIASELKLFTEGEFENIIVQDGKVLTVESADICRKYNADEFSPRDGELVKAADELSAFIEATEAIANGGQSGEFQRAKWSIKEKYESRNICGIHFGQIYSDFA